MGVFKNLSANSGWNDLDLFAKSKYNGATFDYDIATEKVTFAQLKTQLDSSLSFATDNLATADQALTAARTVTLTSVNTLTFNGGLTTFKGEDSTSSNFSLEALDTGGTLGLSVRNDGAIFLSGNRFISSDFLGLNSAHIGKDSGNITSTGLENTSLGYLVMSSVTGGDYNSALGSNAAESLTTGDRNTSIGAYSMAFSAINSSNNSALGMYAIRNNTGNDNTAVGMQAMGGAVLTTMARCVAVGKDALINGTGNDNTGVGYLSLVDVGGVYNCGFGVQAGDEITSGNRNSIFGSLAGASGVNPLITGSDNTLLGYNIQVTGGADSENVVLGSDAVVNGSNKFVVGAAGKIAGATTVEAVVSDATWTVDINGTQYKILLKS